MLVVVDFPELAERTGRFRHGTPYAVVVGGDGARLAFLRSSGRFEPAAALWVLDVATGEETQVSPPGVAAFAVDGPARIAAYALDGRLHRADLVTGAGEPVATAEEVIWPRPDPTGRYIGYVTPNDCLRIVAPDGRDELLAGEPGGSSWRDPGGVRWGVADPAAVEFGRDRGWWWAPDGNQVLAARTAGSTPAPAARQGRLDGSVSLHLLDLDGGWVDVHWDRETYPYLVDVHWGDGAGPLITVLRRMQQHGLVLSVDPRTGETQVHAELADARWVEPIPGTPRYLPDGRVLVGGELAHDGFDARCLFADGSLLTPPGLYVRRVVGVLPRAGAPAAMPDLVVEGTEGNPAQQEVFAVRTSLGGGGAEAVKLATARHAAVGGNVLVIGREVWRGETKVHTLRSVAEPYPYAPAPILARVTDRRLPAAVLYPGGFVGGSRLPVLLTFGEGPGHQQVLDDAACWQERQWWAEQGFAVVSVDSRGTPGVAPSFEKVVHRRVADMVLADHVDALHALVGKHPDLDLSRVAALGTGLGGWLAGMAVTRWPEVFRCGVARDPVLDWASLPTAFAERYLGRMIDSPDVYAHHVLEPSPDLLVEPRRMPGELEFLRARLA